MSEPVRVKCTIEKSPFSGEKFVKIYLDCLIYEGIAPNGFCTLEEGDDLSSVNYPANGYVDAALYINNDQHVITFPDQQYIVLGQ
jgi:hypothetical protein